MLLMAFFVWWYGPGWVTEIRRVRDRLIRLEDTFSTHLLIGSLFAPFRQLSTGSVRGPLGLQMRAMLDRFISRFIGALVRSFMIIFGVIALLIMGLISVVQLVIWPLLPALPILFIIFMMIGWLPWR